MDGCNTDVLNISVLLLLLWKDIDHVSDTRQTPFVRQFVGSLDDVF